MALAMAERLSPDAELFAAAQRRELDFFDFPLAPYDHPDTASMRVNGAWDNDVDEAYIEVRGWVTGTIPGHPTRSYLTSMPLAMPINGGGPKTAYYKQFPPIAKDSPFYAGALAMAEELYPGIEVLAIYHDDTERMVRSLHLDLSLGALVKVGSRCKLVRGPATKGHLYVELDRKAMLARSLRRTHDLDDGGLKVPATKNPFGTVHEVVMPDERAGD